MGTTIGPEQWLAHRGSVERPTSPVHVVRDQDMGLPVSEVGELSFEGRPASEYFKDPEKTASVANMCGWRSLGDMGYVDEDSYVCLTDRTAFMIVDGIEFGPALEVELIEYLPRTARHLQVPRTVEFDPALPRDLNGELYKRRIRERYRQDRASRIVC